MWWKRRVAANDPPETPAQPSYAAEGADALLRRLEWTVLRRLDGLVQGDHRTYMRGGGLDLADLREYQPHDDVRRIDWNVTARLQQPHVRLFLEDRDLVAWFILDCSPSLSFGAATRSKHQVMVEFVAVLARLLTRHGNRVGALVYGNGPQRVIAPGSGRQQVLRLLHAIDAGQAPQQENAPTETRLTDWLRSSAQVCKRRSAVFLVSDFISAPGWEHPLGQLALKHDVLALRLFDPLELDLPDLGMLPLRDAESGERVWVDTHDAGFRKRFARLAAERETALRAGLALAGVDTLELSTEDDLGEALLRLAAMRRRRPPGTPGTLSAMGGQA
ncbi:DUF58 domain-containing protein [Hydrogenophaga aquatica]